MVELPQINPTTDEEKVELLASWWEANNNLSTEKRKLVPFTLKERSLRMKVFETYFPEAKEGTNKTTIPGDSLLKGVQPYKRTVDEGALEAMKEKFREEKIPVDNLFEYKPQLNKRVYNTLSEEARQLVDQVLIIKEESVKLEIVPQKPKK